MCEFGHIGDMVRLAASGLAVAVVPRTFTEPVDGLPGPPEEIRVLSLAEPDSCLAMGFFFQRDRISAPAVRAFIELFNKTRHLSAPDTAHPL
jgi:DNA-binding transcriptional LysR family regulator